MGAQPQRSAMVCYVFGDYELDADGFALKRGREEIPLQPRVFEVLRYLVERNGQLVSKTELLDTLWGDEPVNESVISWSVSHIRRALTQKPCDRTPIETVHRRGYRFVPEVRVHAAATAASAPAQRTELFVGRERALGELERILAEAAHGRGSLTVLSGEAGIGKTRCCEELVKLAAARGMRAVIAPCGASPDAAPLAELGSAVRAKRDREADGSLAPVLLIKSIDALANAKGPSARFLAFEQCAVALRRLSKEQPLLIVLDDVDRANTGTLDWLTFVSPELASMAVCIVTTLRTAHAEVDFRSHAPLQRALRRALTIKLTALEVDSVAALMAADGTKPTPQLAEAVLRASGGVPLFVLEVLRDLTREHGEVGLALLRPEQVRAPDVARDVLHRRLSRLPGTTVELLAKAAVIGEHFELSILASVLELEHAPELVLERLAPAFAEGHVVSEAPHRYRFAHGLFRSVLYDDMPVASRAAVHRRVGELLAARALGSAPSLEVARHYYLSLPAGYDATIERIANEAAWDAYGRLAFDDAVLCLCWALEAHQQASPPSAAVVADLLARIAGTQRAAGRTAESLETAGRALELAMQHGLYGVVVEAARIRRITISTALEPDPLVRRALEQVLQRADEGDQATRIVARALLACVPPYEPDLATSKRLTIETMTLAERLGERGPLFEALRARLFALSGPDDVTNALAVVDRVQALDRAGPRSWQAMDARVAKIRAYLLTGRVDAADGALAHAAAALQVQWGEAAFYCQRVRAQRLFLSGRFDDAEAAYLAAHERAQRAGVAYADTMLRVQQLFLEHERAGARAALRHHARALEEADDLSPSTRLDLMRIAAEAGELDTVRAQLSELPAPREQTRTAFYLHGLACQAIAAAAVRDRVRCEQLIIALSPYEDFNTPCSLSYYLGSAAHFVGILAFALHRPQQARASLERALSHNQALGYSAGVVRTLRALGQLERELGRHAVARQHFTRMHAEATALGMRHLASEATAALATIDGR